MKLSGLIGCLLLTSVVDAWPGVRRRQAQSSTDSCTCPANGPVTTTVIQYTVITSSTTITTESGTVFSTAPASTETVTTTSTATVVTGTTTITSTSTTIAPDTSTSISTVTLTATTCDTAASRRVKRQNSDTTTVSTITSSDTRPIITFTSTISSRVVTCTCTPRPQTTTLSSSSCQCPATTATTITVSTTSSGTVVVTAVSQTPATVTLTPTLQFTETDSSTVTSSVLATESTTQTLSTVTIQDTTTSLFTTTITVNSCPVTTSSTSTTSQSSSSSTTFTGPTASATGSFGCNATAYLVTTVSNSVNLYNIDLNSGATIIFATNVGKGTYSGMNAMGFNPQDNYLYAIGFLASSSTTFAVLRLTTSGSVVEVLRFTSSAQPSVGDFDIDGQFWISVGGTTWWQVDLLPGSSTYGTIVDSGTSTLTGYQVRDWSYLGGQGDYMYTLGITNSSSPTYSLLRWSLDTHTWSVQQAYSTAATLANIATWGGNNGTIWGFSATSGRITRIILPSGTPTALGTGPTGITGGDGARCALAS